MNFQPPNFVNPLGEEAIAAWRSEEFNAALFRTRHGLRLSITRCTYPDFPMSWEELMKVKSRCGFGGMEAVEVYPKDDDVINTGNVRHLLFVGQLPYVERNSRGLQQSNPPEFGD